MADSSDIPKIDRLNKSNYAFWKFNMMNFLTGKTWIKVVDGTVTAANAAVGVNWPQIDAKAKTAIGFSLDEEHLSMVIGCATSKEMWDILVANKKRHSGTSKMLATVEWHNHKFKPGSSVNEYMGGLSIIRAKLRALNRDLPEEDVLLTSLPRSSLTCHVSLITSKRTGGS